MDAFDADVLFYAAAPGHPLGQRVAALLDATPSEEPVGIGSVLLLPELLAKPMRDGEMDEARTLSGLLARLDLRPVDKVLAEIAVALSTTYRLRAADAVHLATAVNAGADRFLTNNKKDFPKSIAEVDVTYPDMLPDPA
jgi:predicted nucleic acid-binding protein